LGEPKKPSAYLRSGKGGGRARTDKKGENLVVSLMEGVFERIIHGTYTFPNE